MRRFSAMLGGILIAVMLAGCGVNWTEITEGGELTAPASDTAASVQPSETLAELETDPPAVPTTGPSAEPPTVPPTAPVPSTSEIPATRPDPADIRLPESFPMLSLLKDPQRFSIPDQTEAPTEPPAPTPEQPPWSPGYTTQLPAGYLDGVNYDRYLPVPQGIDRGIVNGSLAMNYGGYYFKNNNQKVIYITFCMDWENGYTTQMMDMLERKGVKAAFFVTGNYLRNYTAYAKAIINRGHVLGSHSYVHEYTYRLSDVQLINDFVLTQRFMAENLGYAYRYYRPAYGAVTERDLYLAQKYGLTTVMFSFLYEDYDLYNQPSKSAALNTLKSGLYPGAVYYLHDTPCNLQALPDFIDWARSLGYTFLRIDQNSPGEAPVIPTQPPTQPPTEPPTEPPTTTEPPTEPPTTEPPTEPSTEPPTEPPSSETEPSSSETEPSSSETEPSSSETEPSSSETEPSSSETEPSSSETEPSSSETEPSSSETEPSSSETEPSSSETEPSSSEEESSSSEDQTQPSADEPSSSKTESTPDTSPAPPPETPQDNPEPKESDAETEPQLPPDESQTAS